MDYEIVKLKEIADFNKESIGKNSNYEFINYLDTANITNGAIDTVVRIPIEEAPSRAKRIVHNNDIVYSTVRPNLCHYGILDSPVENMIVSTGFTVISCKDDVNPYYVYNYLIQNDITSQLHSIAENSTSAYPSIKPSDLENIEIKLPKLDIQNKIAKILTDIDKKIKINNEINNNLHDLAEQQFKEIYSKGIPKKLDELLFNISTGSRPKGGAQESGVPSIGAEKIEKFGIYDYSSEKYISEDYYEKLKNGKLNSGDVLLYKDGAYTGKVSMCLNGFPHNKAAVNEHVFILNTENNWAQNYLYFVLYNKDNKEMLNRLASSKAAQPGLNQAELKSIEVNICDKEDILKFENNVKPIMEKIALGSLENKRLAELRDTLLPKLMNGEIDLDNIEI